MLASNVLRIGRSRIMCDANDPARNRPACPEGSSFCLSAFFCVFVSLLIFERNHKMQRWNLFMVKGSTVSFFLRFRRIVRACLQQGSVSCVMRKCSPPPVTRACSVVR